MKPLYALGDVLESISAELEANDGELTDDLAVRLGAAEIEWTEKVQRVALMARRFGDHAKNAKAEAARLRARAKTAKAGNRNLLEYLRREMKRAGREYVPGALASPRIQLANPSAEYDGDLDSLPPEFVAVKEERTFKAALAIKLYKEGKPLPEGVTVSRSEYVRVY
jgi:hypothetical protein